MPTHVALLRGINVGGRNKVAMADLRALVAGLGHTEVSTYIQSGNVVFTAAPGAAGTSAIADGIAAAIESGLGVRAPVVVVTRDELAGVIEANPFPDEANYKCLHAVFRSGPAGQELLDRIAAAVSAVAAKGSRDSAVSIGRVLYLHTPDGFGTSELAKTLLRLTASPESGTGTARNWSTTLKLLSLST